MRGYRERLRVPISWWLIVTGCVLLLGSSLWAGLSLLFAVIIYVGLEAACALALLAWGSATIEVTGRDLRAGARRLPLMSVAEVTALDAAQTRALRGPRADPAAYLLVRPYLPTAVYVGVAGRPADRPYWLIGTRRPADLAEAIKRAAIAGTTDDGPPAGQPPGPCDDAAGSDADGAALTRRDGNA